MIQLKKKIAAGILALSVLGSTAGGEETAFPDGVSVIRSEVVEKPISEYREMLNKGEIKFTSAKYGTEEERSETRKWQNLDSEIESANKIIMRRGEIPDELPYYTHRITEEDLSKGKGFNQIRSSLNQSGGTLATANALESPSSLKVGMEIILPVFQGIFIAENPETDFELLLKKEFESEMARNSEKNQVTKKVKLNGRKYEFVPGRTISSTASAFFLSQNSKKEDDKMVLPLARKVLTSEFGYRTSPISKKWTLHAGIDLAAPIGTDVFACKGGVVQTAESNHYMYGNYIDIRHEDKKISRYAHLSKILVSKGNSVKKGAVIGKVGMTGMATGPHLHFEIRENGKAMNPLEYVN